jgi:hypothetical protein
MTAAPRTRELLAVTYSPAVPTVGVEEEFMLVWPDGNAASIAPELLGWLPGGVRAHAGFAPYRVESAAGEGVEPALERSGDTCLPSDLLADRLGRGSGAQRRRALWRLGRPESFVQALANLCGGVDPHL